MATVEPNPPTAIRVSLVVILAGMALFSSFLAAPQKAHASYSLSIPSSQSMKYKDSDGIGSLAIYKGNWNSKYHVYEIDVEL